MLQVSPPDLTAPRPPGAPAPLLQAVLQLHLPARAWVVSAHGMSTACTLEDEEAYTAEHTGVGAVHLLQGGKLEPCGLPTSYAQRCPIRAAQRQEEQNHLPLGSAFIRDSAFEPALYSSGQYVRNRQARGMLRDAMALVSRSPPAPVLKLADQVAWELHGIASGGVLALMAIHPVLGRAVLCASDAGLGSLMTMAKS